jgi:hypothetical protein
MYQGKLFDIYSHESHGDSIPITISKNGTPIEYSHFDSDLPTREEIEKQYYAVFVKQLFINMQPEDRESGCPFSWLYNEMHDSNDSNDSHLLEDIGDLADEFEDYTIPGGLSTQSLEREYKRIERILKNVKNQPEIVKEIRENFYMKG